MTFLHKNKKTEDNLLLRKICFDILVQDCPKKSDSDLFCGVYVDGRNRFLNEPEDFAALKSFKIASAANYPIFVFCSNTDNFLDNNYNLISDWRINVVKIPELNDLFRYSHFFIKELFFNIPEKFLNVICIQPDGFFTGKQGWEDYVLELDVPFLGARLMHKMAILYKKDRWYKFNDNRTPFCNGGFSYRNTKVMREISKKYSKLELAELGNPDFMPPKEDCFFGSCCYNLEDYKQPTLQQCNEFSLDPITLEEFLNKKSYGFHYPSIKNEYSELRQNNQFIF